MSVLVLCDVCFGPHAVAPEQLGSVKSCRYCRASFTADAAVQLEVAQSEKTWSQLLHHGFSMGKRIGSCLLSVAAVALMGFLCTVSPRSAAESMIASRPVRNNPSTRSSSQRPAAPSHAQLRPASPSYPPPGPFDHERKVGPPRFSHEQILRYSQMTPDQINREMMERTRQELETSRALTRQDYFPEQGTAPSPSPFPATGSHSTFGTNPLHPGNSPTPRPPMSPPPHFQPPRPRPPGFPPPHSQPPPSTPGIRY